MERRTFLVSCATLLGAGCLGNAEEQLNGNKQDEKSTTLSLGETYKSEPGVEISVEKLEALDKLTYVDSETGENSTLTPTGDAQFVLGYVSATNTSDDSQSLPRMHSFSVLADGNPTGSQLTFDDGTVHRARIKEKSEDDWYKFIEDAQSGVSATGWLAFPGVPAVDRTELEIRWEALRTDSETVYWSP